MIKLTQTMVKTARATFFKTVGGVNVSVTFLRSSIDTQNTKGFDVFMKTRPKFDETPIKIDCLYKRNIEPAERQRLGLYEGVSGIIYVAPAELVKHFGTFKLDLKENKVQFNDYHNNEIYVIDKVYHLEPVFDTCIAVAFSLRDLTNA